MNDSNINKDSLDQWLPALHSSITKGVFMKMKVNSVHPRLPESDLRTGPGYF